MTDLPRQNAFCPECLHHLALDSMFVIVCLSRSHVALWLHHQEYSQALGQTIAFEEWPNTHSTPKHQHCWEPQQSSRSACSLPHMAQHAYNTIQNMWAAPRVCTCALWTLSGSPAQPHDLPALEEVLLREPHLWSKYLSPWGTSCQKVSQQIGKIHHPPHLSLTASLSQWQRWCGCPMLPSSSWLPNAHDNNQNSSVQSPWEIYPDLLHAYSKENICLQMVCCRAQGSLRPVSALGMKETQHGFTLRSRKLQDSYKLVPNTSLWKPNPRVGFGVWTAFENSCYLPVWVLFGR